jgi:ABC-type oligopeptide transport system ATPase subunit
MSKDSRRPNTPTPAKPIWQQQILQWVYVNKEDKFYLTTDPTNPFYQLKTHQFDLKYQHLVPVPGKQKRRIKPSNLIQKYNPETNMVDGLGMYPECQDRLVVLPNGVATALNICDPVPTYKVENPRRPQVILDHIDYILGGDKELTRHVLNVMCHMVFRPETRLTHGTLISGESGTGKSSIGLITAKLIGVNNANISVDMAQVKGGFQDWQQGNRLALIHEVKEPNNHALFNKIKPIFSEDEQHLNIKHGSVYIANHLHLQMFSNELYPFPIEEGNRRIWYSHSSVKKRCPDYYAELRDAIGHGNREIGAEIPHLYHHLETEILPDLPSNFAYTAPPETEWTRKAISASRNPLAQLLEDRLAVGGKFFETKKWFLKSAFLSHLRDPSEGNGISNIMRNGLVVESTLETHGFRQARVQVNGKPRTIGWFDPDENLWREELFKDTTREGLIAKQKQCYDANFTLYHGSVTEEPEDFELIETDEEKGL